MHYFNRTSEAMAVTLSANVDDHMAQKVRTVADREHRSISNVVSSALTVFTSLPKEVRDTLLELQSQQDTKTARRLAREMMAAMYRVRLEIAEERITAGGALGGDSANEIDLLEEATRLVGDTRRATPAP
jgi:pyruvoyl-dependent arginine decarboxylase (PvlArgDC)